MCSDWTLHRFGTEPLNGRDLRVQIESSMISCIRDCDCHGISAYRLTAPCFLASESINARRLIPLDGQLHVPWQSKLQLA